MRRQFFRDKDGQIIVWFAASLVTLILFAAFSIDMGLIYMTKARLSNSVDSAVLTAAKNASLGETTAKNLGSDMFAANLGTACNVNGVICNWTYCPGDPSCVANSGITATLHATTPWNTTFMAYLPQFAQWTLGDTGQATRSTLVMTIVLDRSGSMCGGGVATCGGESCSNGDDGGLALESAVPSFVGDFSPGTDYLGLVSFASHSSVDVPIETNNFISDIDKKVAAMEFCGGTFGTGAGTNTYSTTNGPPMSLADNQNSSVSLGTNVPEVKVVVYFTDGLMNTVQDNFNCPTQTVFNYGGSDSGTAVFSLDPTNENDDGNPNCYNGSGCASSLPLYDTPSPGTVCSPAITKFPSQQTGTLVDINRANVTAEAQYRAIYTANQMRGESPVATYIFTIGLSSAVTGSACVEAFLSTVANDPNGPTNYSCPSAPAVYNGNLPQGEFFPIASCPGSQCTSELTQAFQVIASKVLLRLSQ